MPFSLVSLLTLSMLYLWQTDLPTEVPKQNPYTTASDVQRGKHLFAANCAVCHGPDGAGGRGANLSQPKLQRAPDDQALFFVIRQGVPGTEMPPAWWVLDEHEIWQVAAYVRSLGRIANEPVAGDAQAGGALFRAQGCIKCHQVGADGGRMGPALSDIGSRRGVPYLRAVVLEPASSLPEDFLQVLIVTRDGRRVTGIRLNEDPYSIQIRDVSDRLLSFWKEELASIERQAGKTPMPAFRSRLSDRELNDLVAYLASLRGNR